MSAVKTARIRELNDTFRQSLTGGRVVMTNGILTAPDLDTETMMQRVRDFTDFATDNDPYGEHDFGSLEVGTYKIFWKIDYYDKSLEYGSEDPSEPAVTTRIMTIMLAEEY